MQYRTRRKIEDAAAITDGVLVIALVLALVVGGFWLHFAAPCKYVTWMPVKDVPTRCLEVHTR